MNVYRNIEEVPHQDDTYITMGTFDGIHIGHQKIIEQLIERSPKDGCRSALVTFYPHPQTVVGKRGDSVKILTPLDEKIDLMKHTNLDTLIVIDFTKELSEMNPETFVQEIFVRKIGVKRLIVGYNHSFGRSRAGDDRILNQMGRRFGFSVDVVPPVKFNNQPVSSTRIRHLLFKGEIIEANELLGRNYSITGFVQQGKQIGNKLGFPTANIDVKGQSKLLPKDGVYAVNVVLDKNHFKGMVNIGVRPTFGQEEHSIEVFIHDFSSNIYEKEIRVNFVDRIRDEKKFPSIDDLKKQIESDRIESLKLLAKNSRRTTWG